MRIIEIVDGLGSTGGVENFVYDLCSKLNYMGNKVTLIAILHVKVVSEEVERLRKEGVEIIQLNAFHKRQAIMHFIPELQQIIKKITAKEKVVCNVHLKLSVLMGALSTIGLKNVYCIETYHSMYHHYHLQLWVLRPFIKKYITVSETARVEMHSRFHVPKSKIAAVPNGVDRSKIRNSVESIHHKKNYISVVSVGRMSYEKNFQVSVRAFSTVCNEKIHYTVVGDGPDRDELKSLADNNHYIEFTGALSRNKVLSILSGADLVVMPSLWEGRSIFQLEAMAFNLPMIISDVPALREPFGESELNDKELYRKCKFGYLVKTNVISAYQNALKDFVSHTESHADMQKYVEKISEENDLSIMAEKYLAVYQNVLQK